MVKVLGLLSPKLTDVKFLLCEGLGLLRNLYSIPHSFLLDVCIRWIIFSANPTLTCNSH